MAQMAALRQGRAWIPESLPGGEVLSNVLIDFSLARNKLALCVSRHI